MFWRKSTAKKLPRFTAARTTGAGADESARPPLEFVHGSHSRKRTLAFGGKIISQ